MKRPEILAPAGTTEALETACLYGADAVYLGLQGETSLRAFARNFSPEELVRASAHAHGKGVKVYLALNTYPHDAQYEELPGLIRFAAQEAGVDAFIVSDPGVLAMVRKGAPSMPVHLSTQANAVSSHAVNAWADLGVARVILARELSAEEIRHIRRNTACELEMFIHGSVCISVSGRCLISDYLAGRGANQGRCTQPCRWDYALVERTRNGQYMPVMEEDGFTFLYNSKDLCLLPVFHRVMALGLDGLKIEGRNKAPLYVATVVAVYRKARDVWLQDPEGFAPRSEWMEEIAKVSNREFFTGFFDGRPDQSGVNYDFRGYEQSHHLAAKVLGHADGMTVLEARNPLIEGMELEWLSSAGERQTFLLNGAVSEGESLTHIRPNQVFSLKTPFVPVTGELVRKAYSEGDKVVQGRGR
ncbi:MAG TPA: U32 family peptidase [Deltaproteobacteria bacterium]|nr:U32 family peptidase [Deltaproteobacteria bacterium]